MDRLAQSRVMTRPDGYLQQHELHLEMLRQRLEHAGQNCLQKNTQRFRQAAAQLDALSPLKVLGRGYAMATREDRVVRSVTQLEVGDTVTVSLSDGTAQCRVEGLQRRKQRGKKTDI